MENLKEIQVILRSPKAQTQLDNMKFDPQSNVSKFFAITDSPLQDLANSGTEVTNSDEALHYL